MLRILLCFILIISCQKEKISAPIENQRPVIANLADPQGSVEYKQNKDIQWKPAKDKLGFFAYDKVKTGTNSKAKVIFTDHSILDVFPESIAIIINRTKGIEDISVLKIDKGNIKGTLLPSKTKTNTLEVKTIHKDFKLKNKTKNSAEFAIKLKKENVEVTTTKNNVLTIELDDKEEFIKADQVKTIGKLTEPPQKESQEAKKKPRSIKVPKNEKAKKKPFFKLDYPNKDLIVNEEKIKISGDSYGHHIMLNGKIISKGGKFLTSHNLKLGLNILTFQFVYKDKVEFKVIKVERKN